MFRNRTNSQKPGDELYAQFKQSFPNVRAGTATSSVASQSITSTSDGLAVGTMNPRQFDDHEEMKDHDEISHETNEHWRFTPSMLDTNSFSFAAFANQPPGYYTPTPGGMNTLYHSQAGDLHTPGMGIHLGTPLSMPISEASMHAASSIDMNAFNPQMLHAQAFNQQMQYAPQQSYAPSSFVHQDSGYGAMDASNDGSPENDVQMEDRMTKGAQLAAVHPGHMENTLTAPLSQITEKFRYHVTLNAPTAMIRSSDEIPVTYLNKGQAYSMTIVDSMPLAPSPGPIKYRTFVRISFEDEQQRQKPSACWQLWKEGRGLAEAHQRGGRLQAVEYVDPNQGGDDEVRRSRIELESASFDGFSVVWTPNGSSNIADCSVAVRFNFLSTDFSHSKGVKGIPVRLCAKTEMISSGTPDSPPAPSSEVCFCKVKLFRDHGAERKLSNDVAHVKKTIDKLKQQISQVESGIKDFGKRKRSGSMIGKSGSHRPGKVQKHKRTWSVSSHSSAGRPGVEEDLHSKLATVQDMFTSTRPISVLYLRGLEHDDPDVFPVSLPGEPQDLIKVDAFTNRKGSWEQPKPSTETTPTNSCQLSPSLSSDNSISTQPQSMERAMFQKPTPFDPTQTAPSDWSVIAKFTNDDLVTAPQTPTQSVKVEKSVNDQGLPSWIEALGVDSSYKAPPEKPIKPVACFYVLIKVTGETPEDDLYRAVYLMQRTVDELIRCITSKCKINGDRVRRTIRINPKGLKVVVDDEVVQELPEGQDMMVEFADVERSIIPDDDGGSVPTDATKEMTATALEMKLIY